MMNTLIKLLSLSIALLASSSSYGQQHWTAIDQAALSDAQLGEREIIPNAYTVNTLDEARLRKDLNKSPLDTRSNKEKSGTITLPMPDGKVLDFKVWYSPVMHPDLAKKYPSIKTYRIVSVDNSYINGRIGMSNSGLNAVIRHPGGEVYIDPYGTETTEVYISYFTKDNPAPADYAKASCGAEFSTEELAAVVEHNEVAVKAGEDVFLKKYRFALACTGEWGQNFNNKTQVMEQMVAATNRVNQSLENEVAVFFELIANNDDLIFLDPISDPYSVVPSQADGVHPGRQVLGQNTSVINNAIGNNSYDVGHVFTRSCTDGIAGVASLGSVCTSNKGSGLSCVGGQNVVNFMVETTIHEIGHQFGASHTWSNCSDASADQLSSGTAFEPGSGTTHMSYAGACASSNNVAGTNDDYFHVSALIQMYSLIAQGNGSTCGEIVATDNSAPDVFIDREDGFSIPVFTPFELTGRSVDAEDDNVTYCWEQFNLGPVSVLGSPIGNAPAFRSFNPTASPTRVFPRMLNILANTGSNSEKLQDISRKYNFMLTVRDNHPGAGGVTWEEIEFESNSAAGPFFVMQPNNNEQLEVGKEYEIRWDVAGTDQAPINCSKVDITLSANGGTDFDIPIATQTDNDGSHTIIVPNHITNDGRIKIKSSDNIFFDVSNFDFDINPPTVPSFFIDVSDMVFDVCTPDVVTVDISTTAFLDFASMVNLEVTSDLPEGSLVTLSESTINPDSGTAQLTLDFNNVNATGTYTVSITGTADGADSRTQTVQVQLTSTNFDDLSTVGPVHESSGVSEAPTFEWTDAINASTYRIEIGTNPALGTTADIIVEDLTEPIYTSTVTLEKNTVYYWKLFAQNKCSDFESSLNTFATEALSCRTITTDDLPINISQSATPTIKSTAFVSGSGQVTDVNIQNIKIRHENANDVRLTLISPTGTEAVLLNRECNFNQDINCGFDDSAASEIACPLNDLKVYVPEQPLSVFLGEEIVGDWIMQVQDLAAGNGGQFINLELEVCSNAVLEGPTIVNNNPLEVPTNGANRLNSDVLLTTDANNSADELEYTIITTPVSGMMSVSGQPVIVGSRFTQSDIEQGRVRYEHDGSTATTDGFSFVVQDGEGGWIPVTDYELVIGDNFLSSTEDTDYQYYSVDVFPNPASDYLTVAINSEVRGDFTISLFDMTGKALYNQSIAIDDSVMHHIEATDLPSGMLIVKIQNGANHTIQMTSIQH